MFSFNRIGSLHPCWCWQMRFECAKNVNKATDKMMQACGGSGYKRDLGKDAQTQVGLPVDVLLTRSVWLDSVFYKASLDTIRTSLQVDISSMGQTFVWIWMKWTKCHVISLRQSHRRKSRTAFS